MNRCTDPEPHPKTRHSAIFLIAACTALTCTTVTFPLQTQAQQLVRTFPAKALRGTLQVTAWPEVLLNGEPARLSPGARIHNSANTLVLPATLTGQTLLVNYLRESSGLLHEVWLLTPAEAKEKRASSAGAQP